MIEGVSTSTAGFVGRTQRGPTAASLVTSWSGYQRRYGGLTETAVSYLPWAIRGFFENGGRRAYVARVVGAGRDGDAAVALADYARGLRALESVDEIALVCVPDEVRLPDLRDEVLGHCERCKYRFAVVQFPSGQRPDLQIAHDSRYGAAYWPWIRVPRPGTQEPVLVPPGGHVAGVYARTDLARGVHRAPANEEIHGLVASPDTDAPGPLEFEVRDDVAAVLAENRVNGLRDFRFAGRGIRVWGARTLSSDPEWKYVNVRRLTIYLEHSIDMGMQWAVFEPNEESTWANVRSSVTTFLTTAWRSGAFPANKPEDAFFVLCDRTTMTQDDIDSGRLVCLIGFAPVRPAEFVILRIAHQLSSSPPDPGNDPDQPA